MILSGNTIRARGIMIPHRPRSKSHGMSYGESFAGYDIRIANRVVLWPVIGRLAISLEKFVMPLDVLGRVSDKSTLARLGVAVQNTIIEPGWRGFLTLELSYTPTSWRRPRLVIEAGSPIAQVIFDQVDCATEGYGNGKYQNAAMVPQEALFV